MACGRLLPDKVSSSKTLSMVAESLPPEQLPEKFSLDPGQTTHF